MTEAEVLERTRAYIAQNFLYMRPNFALKDDDSLLATRVIDSLGVMELVQFVEKEFAVKVAPWEISEETLGTLNNIARYVSGKA